MSKYHREYFTKVDWKRYQQAVDMNVFQINFNLYRPPQVEISILERVLTFRRDELPKLCNCTAAVCMKRLCYDAKHILKAFFSSDFDASMKKYYPGPGFTKGEIVIKRIFNILKSIKPLPKEEYPYIVRKIFKELREMPEDADFIHVDIYELEKVRIGRTCAICMEDFEENVIATRLPCLHIFHGHCIVRCLETNHKCPFCRDPLPHGNAAADQLVPRENNRSSYYTEIELKQPCTPSPSSVLEIRLNHYHSDQQGWLLPGGEVSRKPIDSGKIYLKTEPQLLTIPGGNCELQPTMITRVLTSMSVPRHEQPPIVAKIFETIATKNNADGGAFVNVDIYREALELYHYRALNRSPLNIGHTSADHPFTNEIDTRSVKYKFKPATKSAIEGLERVKVDKSCGVCNGNFEEGLVATRLPCLHIFHAHCVLSRLETDHKCPLCRYPLLCAELALSQNKLDSRLKFKRASLSSYFVGLGDFMCVSLGLVLFIIPSYIDLTISRMRNKMFPSYYLS